jgi:hypothetical protein
MQRIEGAYTSLGAKPYDSFYLYLETTLNHPISRVWPHVLNIGGWMSAHPLETIDGKAGEVGYFQRVYPAAATSGPAPNYHLYGISEIVPLKHVVLDVFPENGGSYGNDRPRMSFNTISTTEIDGRTVVGYQMIDVHLGRGGDEFCARRTREMQGVRELLLKYFDNLKQLVEANK